MGLIFSNISEGTIFFQGVTENDSSFERYKLKKKIEIRYN